MSRIQQILDRAERDGAIRRTGAPAAVGSTVVVRAMVVDDNTAPPNLAEPFSEGEAAPTKARPVITPSLDRLLVAGLAPRSDAAEQYRAVRARLAQHENGAAIRTLLVTSAGAGEGKSITAANLALTMAQEIQSRVIVVDASLRQPRLHQLFGLPDGPGLAEVLTGSVSLEDAILTVADQRLSVLPAGTPPEHPTELLGSAAMRRVVDTLRTRFDRVVLDMPAAGPLADVETVAPLADGVLLVVRTDATTRPALDAALAGFEPGKVVGVVLNGTN